jgi:outer membrane protein
MRSRNIIPKMAPGGRGSAFIAVLICILPVTLTAQEQPVGVGVAMQPAGVRSLASYPAPLAGRKADVSTPLQLSTSVRWNAAAKPAKSASSAGPRRITLEEAQHQAAQANNPMLRLAALGVEAAKQHRLGAQSDFFPKFSSTFANLHFNKFMGDVFLVRRPLLGTTTTIAVPLVFKDETMVATTVMQPLTPLFKLNQVVTIARADERVAKAKAGLPAKEVSSDVERSYFELLVAQRQRQVAEGRFKMCENKWRLASASTPPAGMAEYEVEWIEDNKALVLATSKVKEAAVTLNALLGWPADTELEPVIPMAFFENISAPEAVGEAMQSNPEVVEAQQTLVKARAVSKLSKLDYVPDVALVGGYAYQTVFPVLPNDFSYIGVMASYNLFDFGKREHTVKERNAQVAMAETALQLVKAKVAASVTKAYLDLDRARQLSELARRMDSVSRAMEVAYEPEEATNARAKREAETLQAELDHRVAFSRLQQLMGAAVGAPGK